MTVCDFGLTIYDLIVPCNGWLVLASHKPNYITSLQYNITTILYYMALHSIILQTNNYWMNSHIKSVDYAIIDIINSNNPTQVTHTQRYEQSLGAFLHGSSSSFYG